MDEEHARACEGLRALLAAAAWLGCAVAGATGLAQGPLLVEASPDTATVWTRLDGDAHARLRYQLEGKGDLLYAEGGDASSANDHTVKFALSALSAGSRYAYAVGVTQPDGSENWSGISWLQTAAVAPATVSFAVLADFADGGKSSPALATAVAQRPGLMAVIGDMDHTGPAIDPTTGDYYPPEQWQTVLDIMRAMHRIFRDPATPIGAQVAARLVASSAKKPQIPFFEAWDDHDYCANNADVTCPFRTQAFDAWREYFGWVSDSGLAEGGDCGNQAVYQALSLGQVATVLMLDERSQRTGTGLPGGTTLGACQLAWLIDRLQTATTPWKFILSPVTFNPTTKTWDAWGAFADERAQLLAAVKAAGVRNVVVLSGDIHSGGAIDDGTHSGLPEVSVPHANMPANFVNTYCRLETRVATLVSEPGTWTLGTLVEPNIGKPTPVCFGKKYPHGRIGPIAPPPYPLDGTNAAGFVRVDATATTATIQVLDEKGHARSGFRVDGSKATMRLDLAAH